MVTIADQIINLKPEDLKDFVPEMGKIYSGLPNEQYHSFKDIESSSTVKRLMVSLKHRQDMINKSTDAMAFGTLFHDAMESLRTGQDLTEFSRVIDRFKRNAKAPIAEFIIKYHPLVYNGSHHELDIKELSGKTKQDLMDQAEEIEEIFLDGKQKVATEDFDRSQLMVDAINEHPTTSKIIELDGDAELSFFSEVNVNIDGENIPVKVRVRPDDLIEFEDEIWVIDWKSIGDDATDRSIKNACWKWRYDLQAAMYQDVLSTFTDKPVYFRFVFAESVLPAKEKVRVIQLGGQDIEAGWEDYRKALKNKAEWIRDNSIWTGFKIPEDGIDTIEMRSHQF